MSSNFLIGKNIGNYRIASFIAGGGFGAVYKGQHSILSDRVVAIKVLRTVMLDSPQEREKFLQEAQLLEKLKHPHILPIIDVGIHDDIPYIITEYAARGSLQEQLQQQQQRPLPLQEAQAILLQIGQALHFAHQERIIHRDLKPANILFRTSGEAMLADFGIATLTETARTISADAIGSPPYMAPEQFDGMVSMKSDQYALGCIAYELFTGYRPFQSPADPTWFAWRQKHLTDPPPAPSQINSYLAPSIEQALLKALAKDRLHRHSDIATFVMAIATPTLSQSYKPEPTPPSDPATTGPGQDEKESVDIDKPSEPEEIGQAEKPNVPKKRDKAGSVSGIPLNEWRSANFVYFLLLLGPIGWPIILIILLMNLKKHFVRFHAGQALWFVSLFTFIGFILLALTTGNASDAYGDTSPAYVPLVITDIIVASLYFILWGVGLTGVSEGKYTKLPIIGKWAEKFANKVSRSN